MAPLISEEVTLRDHWKTWTEPVLYIIQWAKHEKSREVVIIGIHLGD